MGKPEEDGVLLAKLSDALRIAGKKSRPHFVGFLDERQAQLAENYMRQQGFENYMLWGGSAGLERVVFGAFPDFFTPEGELFPIVPVTASFRRCDALTHRDFLGALLSRGIDRVTLGDILVEEGRAVLFVRREVAPFLLQQIDKIGRVGVALREGMEEPLPAAHTYSECGGVVASARLDCVTALFCGVSREKAAALIASGAVQLNHREASVSAAVGEGDKLSVRGKGRFILDRVGPLTKKGRLSVSGRKYV